MQEKKEKTKDNLQEKELLYVGIESAIEFRRNLLESSKKLLSSLQTYEELKKVRVEKYSKIILVEKIITELKFLIEKINKHLPKSAPISSKKAPRYVLALKIEEPPEEPKKETKEETKKVIISGPIKDTEELKKLEEELKEIELKLSTFKV